MASSTTSQQQAATVQEKVEDEATRRARLAREEDQRMAEREQRRSLEKLKTALRERNLAICVGSGVTLYSTAENNNTPLERLKWKGLIQNGFSHLDRHDMGIPPERRDPAISFQKQLLENQNATTDNLLEIAGTLKRLLGQRFPTWLSDVFDGLRHEVRHDSILTSLKKLHQKRVTLFTTNYDDLIEVWCNIPPIDGSNPEQLARWKRKEPGADAVFHPHGYWRNPQNVVLNTIDYYKVQQAEPVQNVLQNILEYRTVLFIGCGGGLNDPNIGKLLEALPQKAPHDEFHHYILLRGSEATPVRDKPLITLRCNDSDDIGPWLEKLLEEDEVEVTLNDVAELNERHKIHSWLAPLQQKNFLIQTWDLEMPGTCDWLSKRDDRITNFLRRNNPSFVWLHGDEGCGKTVLCSSIINATYDFYRLPELGRSRDSLAYFYCSTFNEFEQYTESSQHDYRTFLRTAIHHLCPPPLVFPALQILYRKCTRKHPEMPPRAAELEDTLLELFECLNGSKDYGSLFGDRRSSTLKMSTRPGEIYLIIDGLDKTPISQLTRYLVFIKKLVLRRLEHVHVLVSSRDQGNIRATIKNTGDWTIIALNWELMEPAMRLFATKALEEDSWLEELPPRTKRIIVKRLTDEKRGNFRWVSKKIQELKQLEELSLSEIDKVLPPLKTLSEHKPSSNDSDDGSTSDESTGGTGGKGGKGGDYKGKSPKDPAGSSPRGPTRAFSFDEETSPGETSRNARDADIWMEAYTDLLTKWIYPIIDRREESRMGSRPIKIAILDTGFDENDPFIRGSRERIVATRSWVPGKGENEMIDESGHGTYAMALLLKMAPGADVYAARIAKHSQLAILEAPVAEAIRWAARLWNVDILILPFGFQNPVPEIDAALRVAFQENIHIFCAAGIGKGVSYLASQHSVVTSISSTDGSGQPSLFNPAPQSGHDNFATLGEAVSSSWPRNLAAGSARHRVRRSGTSVATVIAAGIAATLADYAMHDLETENDGKHLKQINHGFRALFRYIGSRRGEYVYLKPWVLFGDNEQDSDIPAARIRELLGM